MERPRQAGDARPDREGEQLVADVVHPHRPGRQLVLPDRHPRPADPRFLEPERDEHGRRHQPEAEEVVRERREPEVEPEQPRRPDPAEALRPVRHPVPVARHHRHDLAEAQRDDRQIVAAQAQGGRAEEHAEERADQRADHEHDPERDLELDQIGPARHRHPLDLAEPEQGRPHVGPRDLELARRGRAVGVGADREERRVAEVQEPREADDDVEPERQEHVGVGVRRRVDVPAAGDDERERESHEEEHETPDLTAPRRRHRLPARHPGRAGPPGRQGAHASVRLSAGSGCRRGRRAGRPSRR